MNTNAVCSRTDGMRGAAASKPVQLKTPLTPDACIAENNTRKPNSASPAPINDSKTYFHAASSASRVLSKETSSAEQSVVNSTTIQTKAGYASTGIATIEKTNKL